jgi:hypothetical protein
VYGPVPPEGVAVAVPFAPPLHETGVNDITAETPDAGSVMVIVVEICVGEHPLLSDSNTTM